MRQEPEAEGKKGSYSIALIDPSSLKAEPKLPVLDLKAETAIDASDFKNAVSMASKVADNVVFSADDGFLALLSLQQLFL